ncbi:UDP-glucosyltransferase 2-like [Periplaneta americana]|uniref:UDP-glucosyltransferase 2-like n=1 Tax=Periplaneta americana TaxID=6978 RepID=UPI0037E8876E
MSFLLVFSSELNTVQCANILALMSVPGWSHSAFIRSLTHALLEKGHQVVELTPHPNNDIGKNFTSLYMKGVYEEMSKDANFEDAASITPEMLVLMFHKYVIDVCTLELQSPSAQELLNYSSTKKFDLIIAEACWADCLYAFVHRFGSPPVIAMSAFGMVPWMSYTMGAPENPSYMPNIFLEHSESMNFVQRIRNFIMNCWMMFFYEFSYVPIQGYIARKYFQENLPSLWEIRKNFSLLFTNNVLGLDVSRPLPPNVIPIGGSHIATTSHPLPTDLQLFLNGAKEGFIYFSFGTLVRSDSLSEQTIRTFVDAFAELPQRVVWKYESDHLPNKTSNVLIKKWLPQSDILAHPKIRLFISHGGINSVIEAVYRGVPVLGIPFLLDQRTNIHKLVAKGAAIKLDPLLLTKENVIKNIREILYNQSYVTNMKKLSAIANDQPELPLDRAVFWTEYVLRHKGAPHLRPASTELYWYQYLLLDVLLVLAAVFLLISAIIYFLAKKGISLICRKSVLKQKKS